MWKLRFMIGLALATALLLLLPVVAYAGFGSWWGWWWNAQIDVESVDLRTEWTVLDDPDGANSYHADIKLSLPKRVEASIVSEAEIESVVLSESKKLKCRADGIEAKASYKVVRLKGAKGAAGASVAVAITAGGARLSTRRLDVSGEA